MSNKYHSDFGEIIKKYRKEMNLTQKYVAEQIGVSKSTYSLYESGKRFPSVEKASDIISILDIPAIQIMASDVESEKMYKTMQLFNEVHAYHARLIQDSEYDFWIDVLFHDYLNDAGKEKVISYGKDISMIKEYRKESAPIYPPEEYAKREYAAPDPDHQDTE